MRKRYRILLLAIIAAACVVPVGFALSLEPDLGTPELSASTATMTPGPVIGVPVTRRSEHVKASSGSTPMQPLPEAGRLALVGGVFFGLAAVARRTV